jgi:hypothetical protein
MIFPLGKMILSKTEKYWDLIKKLITVVGIILSVYTLNAQVIRGTVTGKDDGRPIPGVLISIDDGALGLQSDSEGGFVIEGLEQGRYILRFQHIQFQSELREVQLVIAKESVLNVQLALRTFALPEITLSESRFTQVNSLNQITAEEVQRYPGTFFDPARFASTFPGVQIVNDQANQLVINGMSPDLMQWHLEGLEIVNPNHLANAGTLSDSPTATGGGVNMLSNQVLANSSLLAGAAGGYGNATSGIMDMYFKEGNTTRAEHTVQIGLLGIEGATEGPFKEGGRSSYVINGRYSTIGLLSQVGVDFGDEEIQFYDVSLNTQFYLGEKGAKLKVFGVIGGNSNKFEAKEVSEWEEDKDRYSIDFTANTEIIGATFSQPVSRQGLLTFRAAYSSTRHDRLQRIPDTLNLFSVESGGQNKLSTLIQYNGQLNHKISFTSKVSVVSDELKFEQSNASDISYVGNGNNLLVRPYVGIKSAFSKRLSLNAGIGMSYYDNSATFNFEPDVELNWQIEESQNLTFQYRLSSQSLDKVTYTHRFVPTKNLTLKPLRAHHFKLKYQLALGSGIVEASLNYSSMFNMPVGRVPGDYSPLNLRFYPNDITLADKGTGNSFSFNVGYRRNFTGSYFLSGNASYISSKYKGSDDVVRSTNFDVGYAIYLSGGKEWVKVKDYGQRTWGANGGIVGHGGLYTAEIHESASIAHQRTEYARGTFGNVRLSDYYRIDARLYFRKDKAKHSSTISLDIQNMIGIENEWFSYYDQLFQEQRPTTQLGIIPVLSWRMDF